MAKILMVSSYPPMRCGIGAYSQQSVAQLRKEGNIVDVLSLPGGDGDFVEDLLGGRKLERLLAFRNVYDEIIVQYCPYFYLVSYDLPQAAALNRQACMTMRRVFRQLGNVVVVCHEEHYPTVEEIGRRSARAERLKWDGARRIFFHTRKELERFAKAYGWSLHDPRLALKVHHADFQKRVNLSKLEARRARGWPADKLVFLAIGFIQPTKGFDRAVRAFARVRPANAELFIVGSTRVDSPDLAESVAELERLVRDAPGAHLEVGFVSDEDFDTCIVAADYVLLPYREIWSSSVLARAKLYHRPVVAANVGGLSEQMTAEDVLENSDEELETALRRACERRLEVLPHDGELELRLQGQNLFLQANEAEELRRSLSAWLDRT